MKMDVYKNTLLATIFFRLRLAKNINRNYLILKNFMLRLLYQGPGKHLKIRNKNLHVLWKN